MSNSNLNQNDESDSDIEDTFMDPLLVNNNVTANNDVSQNHGKINENGRKVRGRDIVWVDYESFENADEYHGSPLVKKLEDEFTLRRKNEWDYADVEIFTCKFARRSGFLPCPWQLKVNFLSNSDAVVVETTEEASDHVHEADPEYTPDGSNMFRWSRSATAIITTGVKNEARPKIILRNLRDANTFDGQTEPTMIQLYNKITSVKKLLDKTRDILTTHDLRQKISQHLDVPQSDLEAYIPISEVLDEDDEVEPNS